MGLKTDIDDFEWEYLRYDIEFNLSLFACSYLPINPVCHGDSYFSTKYASFLQIMCY